MKNIQLNTVIYLLLSFLVLTSCNEKSYENVDDMVSDLSLYVEKTSVEDLKAKYDAKEDYYLIDVRVPNEHNFGFIPYSQNLPGGTLLFRITEDDFWKEASKYPPEKDAEIILYCKQGKRSVIAAWQLMKLGYKNVSILEGGWKAWEKAYPQEYDKDLEHVWEEEVEDVGGC